MQLWRVNDGDVSPVDASPFENEKEMQDLIERNPEILPIDADLMVLAREVQCGAGIADFVAVDMQTGQLVIIETKLARNGDRRRAVAQVLDYAADMFDQDLEYLQRRVSPAVWADLDAAARVVLADSLRCGDFRLVIVMDHVDEGLAKVAQFFQSAGARFSIELVALVRADIDGQRLVMASGPNNSSAGALSRPRLPTGAYGGKMSNQLHTKMIELLEQGCSQAAVAEKLGVSSATVSRWKRVPLPS